MKSAEMKTRVCPLCRATYTDRPAISRIDNSLICSDCGIRQSLDSIGISKTEQEKILQIIKEHK